MQAAADVKLKEDEFEWYRRLGEGKREESAGPLAALFFLKKITNGGGKKS